MDPLDRIASALERIADALEAHMPEEGDEGAQAHTGGEVMLDGTPVG